MDHITELNQKIEQMEKELKELKLERMALKEKSPQGFLRPQRAKIFKLLRENDSFKKYLYRTYWKEEFNYGYECIDACFEDFVEKAIKKVSDGKEFDELTLDEKFAVREEVIRLINEMEAKC